jgi:two-component system NtrC family sensor kinase
MGYRLRMTLTFAVLTMVSVVGFAVLFLSSSYSEFKSDRMVSVERMTSCLAGNVYWDIQTGDTQRVDDSLARFALGVPAPVPPVVVVLNPQADIFASTAGPGASSAGETANGSGSGRLASSLALIASRLDQAGAKTTTVESASGFISAARIERDGRHLGTVLVDYPLSSLDRHFMDLFRAAIGYGAVLLLVLLVLGWLLGKRLVRPIRQLRACMQRVGEGDLDVHCQAARGDDEIGVLARGFEEMLAGLRDKRQLEKEMLATERLAAVGQVAAGVAHEINNPLGGMLNAISTFKRHGTDPRVMDKTMDLLERGLRQIQATVSALLVQARVEAHPLAPADLDDLHTLVNAEVRKKGIRLDWRCELEARVPLPSTAVRQVLMNLLLNAIQAAPRGGHVAMYCGPRAGHLLLRVEDDGPGIDPDAIQRLFEPFYSSNGGHGLGLWVTYQAIDQLGGSIDVQPRRPGTAMEVRLPFGREDPVRPTPAAPAAEARS